MKIKEIWKKYKKRLSTIFSALRLPSFTVVIGFLGAFAGSHGTSLLWRRAMIPAIITVCAYITSGMNPEIGWINAFWHVTCMSLWGAYSCGYGIPDDNYPPDGDSGSTVGRFWTMLFRKFMTIPKAHQIADYFTRGQVALVKTMCLISIPILKGNWLWYAVGGFGVILVNSLVSWRGWGSFKAKIFNKEVEFLYSDIVNYTCEGGLYYIIIFWK